MDTKLVDYFLQKFLILSVPLVTCFYWPFHDQRLMKFVCFEMVVLVAFALSFMIPPKRQVNNMWPAVFFLACIMNMFTHLLSGYTQLSLTFCLFAVMAVYTIQNHATMETVNNLKKSIVIAALINFCLFLTQYFQIETVFDLLDQHTRPSGFMCYPVHFSILCTIAFLFAWQWRKWLCLPLGVGILMSYETSVFLALFVMVLVAFRKPLWVTITLITIAALLIFLVYESLHGRAHLRGQFWYPTFRLAWARPLDGFGLGGYRQFFSVIAPKFPVGTWPELHCEPLQLFFEMGVIGLAVFYGWIKRFTQCFTWNIYMKSFLVIAVTCCFHSIFHFGDSLWLIICVYAMWEIERREGVCQ